MGQANAVGPASIEGSFFLVFFFSRSCGVFGCYFHILRCVRQLVCLNVEVAQHSVHTFSLLPYSSLFQCGNGNMPVLL